MEILVVKLPRRPILIISPSCEGQVGSPTMQESILTFFLASSSKTFFVPFIAGPSSSLVISKLIVPLKSTSLTKLLAAVVKAAIADFISAAPLPYKFPSLITASKGSLVHDDKLPTGTTSVCPPKHK